MNFLTLLLLCLGPPMLLKGDEVRLTQHGHNKPYCQDNEWSWSDRSPMDAQADLSPFLRRPNDFIQRLEIVRQETSPLVASSSHSPHPSWLGIKLEQPDGWFYRGSMDAGEDSSCHVFLIPSQQVNLNFS
jgi:glycogen operon protein